ncbi:MAG: anthranilate synthase component I [Solirubrobacterales bacterium]
MAPTVVPDLDEVRRLAAEYTLVPVRHTFIADTDTPVSAFLKLRDGGPCFLLESADQGRLGRWSFLGFRPRAVLRWSDGTLSTEPGEGHDADAPAETATDDPYGAVAEAVGRHRAAPVEGLPPFSGGAVGLFGYDLVRTVEPLGDPNPDPVGLPDLAVMLSEVVLAFDHHQHEVTIIANVHCDTDGDPAESYEAAVGRIAEVRERLRGPVPEPPPRSGGQEVDFRSNMTRERYEESVSRIIEYVKAGDAFQVVPSQRFTSPCPVEAFSIYRGLRRINPSPYMYFLDFGDWALAGASPEPLVTVHGSRVETRPIAGTIPRGATAEEDRKGAERMLADPKERAEHIMLVDLGRNDLGRVCEYGSVTVDDLMAVETYSHVLHIVSSISGRLREGTSAMDVLRSTLPAGTLSGAPKVRAMQIIDELEPHKRGPYGGAVGYLSYAGDLDTAIHIRTVVVKDGEAHVQAGGGTVVDAQPAYEFNESVAKASAVFRAVELAVEQPEWS